MAVIFNNDARKRIAAAVHHFEAMGNDRSSTRLPPGPNEESFWGFIIGSQFAEDLTPLYTFLRVRPEHKNPDIKLDRRQAFSLVDPIVVYRGAALEVSGSPVPSNVAVRMTYTGVREFPDDERRAMYAFTYTPYYVAPFLPVHDHRSNFHGGFAFATYHPGTSLPQMPWAI